MIDVKAGASYCLVEKVGNRSHDCVLYAPGIIRGLKMSEKGICGRELIGSLNDGAATSADVEATRGHRKGRTAVDAFKSSPPVVRCEFHQPDQDLAELRERAGQMCARNVRNEYGAEWRLAGMDLRMGMRRGRHQNTVRDLRRAEM